VSKKSQQITINKKQLIFLGLGLIATIGLLIFLAALLSKKTGPSGLTKEAGSLLKTNAEDGGFLGEKGEAVKAADGKVYIDEKKVSDGDMHSFNFYSKRTGKSVYFFIVKASDGTYRAAANACEVCFSAKKGFKQVGGLIRCENCRVTYPKDKIALEKGGCNPGPIDQDVKVEDGKLAINTSDLEKAAYLF